MNNIIEELLDELYSNRDSWGSAMLAKWFQKRDLHLGGEKTIRRAAEVLKVPYIILKIGGKDAISYPKSSARLILEYILNTNKSQRTQDWLALHPDIESLYEKNKKISLERAKKTRDDIFNQSIYISYHKICKELKLVTYKIIELCEQLNIESNNKTILKTDYEKLKSYLSENYSDDPHIRSRQMASDTWIASGVSILRNKKATDTRAKNKSKHVMKLEEALGIKCYSDKEAAAFIGKNNSTLISGMKLLDLPLYKRGGCYIYDEESLLKLKNFYNNKSGLKGQVARLFEEYIRNKNLDYTCEKTFPNCYWKEDSKHPLRFDYYLPDYNLVVEVQGPQHFNPSSMGAILPEEEILKNFEGLKERDEIKKQYCMNNNIGFIEIIKKEDFNKLDEFIKDNRK